jgi:hypothetical protein
MAIVMVIVGRVNCTKAAEQNNARCGLRFTWNSADDGIERSYIASLLNKKSKCLRIILDNIGYAC